MVSWWHGLGEMKPPPAGGETAVGASTGPARTTTCTETARSTTPPCHHVTMSPPSHSVLYTGVSPCVQPSGDVATAAALLRMGG